MNIFVVVAHGGGGGGRGGGGRTFKETGVKWDLEPTES